ncbi:MAG: glycosyltransferase [Solirubrobacteraceae bacterium]
MLRFCTIVTPLTIAQARVMATSARRHHPEVRVSTEVSKGVPLRDEEPFEVLAGPASQSIPELLTRCLDEADTVVYLDPAICVYDVLEPVLSEARDTGVALVKRADLLPDDGCRPDSADLLSAGSLDPGLVAVHANESGRAFLQWWSERRQEAEQRETPDSADGRWLDLAAKRFPGLAVVADPGCEVSYWNLHERPLTRHGEQVLAAGRPLRSLQFAGFRPDRPYWLSEDATRVRVVEDPVLAELCGEYAERLRDAGWSPPRRQIAGVRRLGNGQLVDQFVENLWTQALAAGEYFGDPLSAEAADEFVAWMREPGQRGAESGVNRYLLEVYLSRTDLQKAFPDLDGDDGDRLVQWGWSQDDGESLGGLLPAAPDDLVPAGSARIAVNVIGYLGETLGLAEAARSYVTALSTAGVPVSTKAITPDLPIDEDQRSIARYGSTGWQDLSSPVAPAFNLACLNGDHLHELIRTRGEGVLEARPTIGQWGWETDVLPASWAKGVRHVDEVWVYSTFMAKNLGRLLPVPVVVVPPAIVTPDPGEVELSMARDDRFTFVFMLDFFSTLERKNPLGLIDAFTRAFSPDEGPRLLIKTINARFRKAAADELRFRAGGRGDIEFVDGYLKPAEKAALLARADCYVSLHRSEGFGLPLAEAMAQGTAVIATGYSGNTDFTTPFNSYLVDWTPTRVGPDSVVYPADGTWAEPDLDHAAGLMRRVWEHPDEVLQRVTHARSDIQRLYAPSVVGAIARARLERLADDNTHKPRGRDGLSDPGLDRLEEALAFDLSEGAGPAPSGAAGMLRRTVLRLIRPFTFHEREVDHAVLAALKDLRAALAGERERNRWAHRRLGQVEATLARRPSSEPTAGDKAD